jgi:hypothetical protein
MITFLSIIDKVQHFLMTYNLSQVASFLTGLAGVAGLGLSIYVFLVNRRDRQPRLSIGVDREEVENDYDDEYGGGPPLDIFFLTSQILASAA